MANDVLTLREAAKFLKMRPETLSRQARAGQVPGQKAGYEWRFHKPTLIEWMKGGQAK